MNEQQIKQLEKEIVWIQDKLNTEKMSKKKRQEYLRQIKHKGLTISLEVNKNE